MKEKYRKELLDMNFSIEVLDGTKPERIFFAITEDDLENKFNVLPSDSLETARKKIMDVVSTDEFLYDYFHKDPRIWEIKKFVPGFWTVPTKEEKILSRDEIKAKGYLEEDLNKMRFPVKETTTTQTYQSKLTIEFAKRKPENVMSDDTFFKLYEKEFEEFLTHDNVFTAILKNSVAAQTPKRNSKQKYDPDKLLVIPDVELHLGKLASRFDSADSYDYKKALYRYIKIILEAEKVANTYKPKEICMTIGNDFFNTDTEQNTTTAGTEQHNDTRFQQMIVNGVVAHVWAIERMKNNCDKLIIKFNPGNHDFLTDYMLYMQLYYRYENDPKVEIECKVKDSRWATGLSWHNNLIIFAHGKTPEGKALNDDKLALLKDNIMFNEAARNVDHVTVLAGHLHNSTENNFSRRKTTPTGVTVLRNGSPSGDAAWDSGNLYSSDKSHQAYIFDAERGYYSTINLQLTKEDLERRISVPTVNDDTDYVKVVDKSINQKADDIITEDAKKLITSNEKDIKQVEKKYEKILKKLSSILDNPDIASEKKQEILTAIGYEDEIKPYIERRKMLQESLALREKEMSLSRKA